LFKKRTDFVKTLPPGCPTTPIVATQFDGGRLCNQIWAYAAVWSVARQLGRPGYAPDALITNLKTVFANLSLQGMDEIKHCKLDLGSPINRTGLRSLEAFKGQNMLLQSWMFLPKLILKVYNNTKDEMRFRPDILRDVEATVERVGGKNRTRVGIHVRRTDFASYLSREFHSPLVGANYFQVMDNKASIVTVYSVLKNFDPKF
jgi:hypothetical protein